VGIKIYPRFLKEVEVNMPSFGIKIRLESVLELQTKYEFLKTAQVQEIYNEINSRFRSKKGKLKPHLHPLSDRVNIEEMDPSEVRQFLLSLKVAHDEIVWLIWCSDETGISITFRDFVQYYDDLWYPSSDDIWVTEKSLSWLLEFDHEEIVTFTKLR
jgi:hypothetical protein